jgi:signal transduction histidine kinase
MPPPADEPRSERDETDESLRVEREKVDHALDDQLAAVEETADAVISLARARADQVLAAARAKTDEQWPGAAPAAQSRIIAKERSLEDAALRAERAEADETLREERAQHVGLVAIEREETDKDLDSERARSDAAVTTRDEFLGIVTHDLRDLLGAMVGYAALIAKEVSQENHVELVAKHAQRIQRAGARMNRLIGDLIDVASIDAGMLAVTRDVADPAHVVTEAVDTFQAQAAAGGIALVSEIVPPSSPVAFDSARILQVLTNLLSNAIKFTPADGRVVVRLEPSGDDLRFSVSDSGVGIAADKLEAVFERFVQVAKNDRRGVGLGLYISRCIVEGHGGRIWAESRPGEGSTFCFTLPVSGAR